MAAKAVYAFFRLFRTIIFRANSVLRYSRSKSWRVTSCITLTKSSDKQIIRAYMDALVKLLPNDVPGAKLNNEIVEKNSGDSLRRWLAKVNSAR